MTTPTLKDLLDSRKGSGEAIRHANDGGVVRWVSDAINPNDSHFICSHCHSKWPIMTVLGWTDFSLYGVFELQLEPVYRIVQRVDGRVVFDSLELVSDEEAAEYHRKQSEPAAI